MTVPVAAALDARLGEPPVPGHPVVWMGTYLDHASQHVPPAPPRRAMLLGATAWLGGVSSAALAGAAVHRLTARLPRPWRALIRGAALWPLLSLRLLCEEVAAVEGALDDGTESGRAAASRIVSRDTSALDPAEIRAAAIESLAENLSDSVVAPLCWYVVAGVPGAAAYRFVNTADACWGYRSPRWRHAGLVAARADDLLNLLPARLTAGLLYGAGDWQRLHRQARRTPSPNAGWPMAALALRLDLRLAKPGTYVLNPGGIDPGPGDIHRALRAVRRAAAVAIAATAVADHLKHRRRGGTR